MAGDAANVINDAAGVAAAAFAFTRAHKQVTIINLHATQVLTVRVFTGSTAAFAKAKAVATPAVIGASDNYALNALGRAWTIGKSSRRQFFAISVIASGATTPFIAAGEDWTEGA
jgi:hypothetical protein